MVIENYHTPKRRVIFYFFIVLIALSGAVYLGYAQGNDENSALRRLSEKLERKLRSVYDTPSDLEIRTAKIETTFLELHGRIFRLPEKIEGSGGAVAIWRDTIVVIGRNGHIFYKKQSGVFDRLNIDPPHN